MDEELHLQRNTVPFIIFTSRQGDSDELRTCDWAEVSLSRESPKMDAVAMVAM